MRLRFRPHCGWGAHNTVPPEPGNEPSSRQSGRKLGKQRKEGRKKLAGKLKVREGKRKRKECRHRKDIDKAYILWQILATLLCCICKRGFLLKPSCLMWSFISNTDKIVNISNCWASLIRTLPTYNVNRDVNGKLIKLVCYIHVVVFMEIETSVLYA